MWALLAISVVLVGWGCLKGLTANDGAAIDVVLFWAYALIVIAALAIILGIAISCAQDKKMLLKIAIIVVAAIVIIGGAFLLAPAAPCVGLVGIEPTHADLKLTDTVLNLTYLFCGASIVAILFSAIFNAIRK